MQQQAPPPPSGGTDTVTFLLNVNKARHEVALPVETATFGDLQCAITRLASIPPANQKIFLRGRRVDNQGIEATRRLRDCEPFVPLLVLAAPTSSSGSIDGGPAPVKLKVIGSTEEDIQAVQAAVAAAKAKVEEREAREREESQQHGGRGRPRRWRLVPTLNGVTSSALPHGFRQIEPLPGLPDMDRATKILHKLASDPGVVAVMRKHKFAVGCLTELYPKGQVGRSASCLMGLNVNKGEKICLRIRTDDLRGFRKYLSVREVLFHELTHQVHSEHDAAFWAFMSQLQKDAAKLDWTQSAGRRLGGGSSLDYEQARLRQQLEAERAAGGHDEDRYGVATYALEPDYSDHGGTSFEGGKAQVGGSDFVAPADRARLSPRSLRREQALVAVALRRSRQQQQQQRQQQQQPTSQEKEEPPQQQQQQPQPQLVPSTEALPVALPPGNGALTGGDNGGPAAAASATIEPSSLPSSSASAASPLPPAAAEEAAAVTAAAAAAAAAAEAASPTATATSAAPAATAVTKDVAEGLVDLGDGDAVAASVAAPPREQYGAAAASLEQMGFSDHAAVHAALAAARGSVERAVQTLVSAAAAKAEVKAAEVKAAEVKAAEVKAAAVKAGPARAPAAAAESAAEMTPVSKPARGGGGGCGGDGDLVRRKQSQLRAALRDYGLQGAPAALRLLLKLTGNVLSHPGDPRFRRVNLGGKAVRGALGVGPAAVAAAGVSAAATTTNTSAAADSSGPSSFPSSSSSSSRASVLRQGFVEALTLAGWKRQPPPPQQQVGTGDARNAGERLVLGAHPDIMLQWLLKEAVEKALAAAGPEQPPP